MAHKMVKTCFLLAAGLGTRLRPITNSIPKCLVEINDKPLLQYWFELLEAKQIEEIFINLHYLPEQVSSFINNYKTRMKIIQIHEEHLLGSLGTLLNNYNQYSNNKSILVCYADNLTNIDLNKFYDLHNSHDSPMTIGLFRTKKPTQCGIVKMDKRKQIISFVEKPKFPQTNLANAGIYLIETSELKFKKKVDSVLDISYHLLPDYINNMVGYEMDEFLCDIGDINNLRYAIEYVESHSTEFVFQ